MGVIQRLRRAVLVLFCVACSLPALSVARATDSDHREALVSELDALVQRRFLDIDKGFGFRRIGGWSTAHIFQAENAEERHLTAQLKASGADLMMFLASIAAYAEEPSGDALRSEPRLGIRGPVWVTERKKRPARDLRPLWQAARRTLADPTGRTVTRADGWTISARVVRAADSSCVTCHTTRVPLAADGPVAERLKRTQVGDPLGVVLYVYR